MKQRSDDMHQAPQVHIEAETMGDKKICFFSGDITRCGGTERVSTILANELHKKTGYQVTFLSIMEQSPNAFFGLDDGIDRHVLARNRSWIKPGIGYVSLVPRLRAFLKKQRFDVLVDVDIVLDALSIPASVGLSHRLVSWQHFHFRFEQSVWYRRWILRMSAKWADDMVTLTEKNKRCIQEKTHRKKRITVIGNPMPTPEPPRAAGNTGTPEPPKSPGTPEPPKSPGTPEPLKSPETSEPPEMMHGKEKMIITVGYLVKEKGTDLIARLAPSVLREHPDWKWYLLGDGVEKETLQTVAQEQGLERQLILEGQVANVMEYMRRAAFLVMPSRMEGYPMSLLEARSCQLPCISFDVFNGAEIIEDGVTGYLVEPFDVETFAMRIRSLIQNPGLRRQMSENCASGNERFSLQRFVSRWEQVLR